MPFVRVSADHVKGVPRERESNQMARPTNRSQINYCAGQGDMTAGEKDWSKSGMRGRGGQPSAHVAELLRRG